MVSTIYIVLSAIIIIQLSLNVIKIRAKYKISVGDGGNEALQTAIGAQSNAVEYLPIALILLISLELNNANTLFIHALGIMLITGRIIHAKGILIKKMKHRVIGMQITFLVLVILAIMNTIYLPYEKLIIF